MLKTQYAEKRYATKPLIGCRRSVDSNKITCAPAVAVAVTLAVAATLAVPDCACCCGYGWTVANVAIVSVTMAMAFLDLFGGFCINKC